MKYLELDYRISLLRTAAFHGASHQATMVFQVVVPKQLREIEIGCHRIQYIYQTSATFANTNLSDWLLPMKSQSDFARAAGVELTLLDCARYFRKAAGIDGVAQIAKEIGAKADPHKLAKVALSYDTRTPQYDGSDICWIVPVKYARLGHSNHLRERLNS